MIIPFKKTYVYAGFGSASGLVKFEKRTLVIEYRTVDEIINFFKSETKQITFQLSDIDSVAIKRGWFSYKLLIDLKSLKTLDQFPAVNGNQIKLRVSRKNSEKLNNLKSTLALALSEHKLRELDYDQEENDSIRRDNTKDATDRQRSDSSDRENNRNLPNALERRDKNR